LKSHFRNEALSLAVTASSDMAFDSVGCSKVVWRWKGAWRKEEERSASGKVKLQATVIGLARLQ
jgi:hypothetical protein